MNTALICFSDAGAVLAQRIADILHLEKSDIHSITKFAEKYGFAYNKSVNIQKNLDKTRKLC